MYTYLSLSGFATLSDQSSSTLVFFMDVLLEDRMACNAASHAHFRSSTITQDSHNKVR